MKNNLYAQAGVDLELEDKVSEIFYEAARETWKNRRGKLGEIFEARPDFRGFRGIHVGGLPEGTYLTSAFEEVGTKIELGERAGCHNTVAFDLFAMVCDDLVRYGVEPVVLGSVLIFRTLKSEDGDYIELARQLAEGYVAAARKANVAVINGELGEHKTRIQGFGKFNYEWTGGAFGFAHRDKFITGINVAAGDYIIGLREEGFRANGISLVTDVLSKAHGPDWHNVELGGKNLGELVLEPSIIYTPAIVDMLNGWQPGEPKIRINAIAHITGGGIPAKLGSVLKPSGLTAVIDAPSDPPEIMRYCQEIGGVSDREAYKTWNMGYGMMVVIPPSQKSDVLKIANEHGLEADHVGFAVRSIDRSGVKIISKGIERGRTLLFQV